MTSGVVRVSPRRQTLRYLSLILALTLPVLGACRSDDARQADVPVPPRLEPAPSGCEGRTPGRLVSLPAYGGLIGRSPVWAGFYATFDGERQAFHVEQGAPRTDDGWRVKVLWIVGPELSEKVRVRGQELVRGAPLLFELEDQGPGRPVRSATLDPLTPGVRLSVSGYREVPLLPACAESGCYRLEAAWPGGRWRLVFGLGR